MSRVRKTAGPAGEPLWEPGRYGTGALAAVAVLELACATPRVGA